MIVVEAVMSREVAQQFMQFAQRASFDVFYALTEPHLPEEERRRNAYLMISGIEAVRTGIAESSASLIDIANLKHLTTENQNANIGHI